VRRDIKKMAQDYKQEVKSWAITDKAMLF
jgi:hypothetical protein